MDVLEHGGVCIAASCGLLLLVTCVACATSESVSQESVEYYAPEDVLMRRSFGEDPSAAAIFDLKKKLAYFGHVVADLETCAPDEPYYCLRGRNLMPFAVPKQYSGQRMWEFEGHTYRLLPDHASFSIFELDHQTLQFYVDEPANFVGEQAFTRYVFIWSEDLGLVGWASSIHGCSISVAELMELPAHDYRHACSSQGFVVAKGGKGLFSGQ